MTAIPLNSAAVGPALLVIDARARPELADGRYAPRRRACEHAASVLGVWSQRDLARAAAELARVPPVMLGATQAWENPQVNDGFSRVG